MSFHSNGGLLFYDVAIYGVILTYNNGGENCQEGVCG